MPVHFELSRFRFVNFILIQNWNPSWHSRRHGAAVWYIIVSLKNKYKIFIMDFFMGKFFDNAKKKCTDYFFWIPTYQFDVIRHSAIWTFKICKLLFDLYPFVQYSPRNSRWLSSVSRTTFTRRKFSFLLQLISCSQAEPSSGWTGRPAV